MNASSWHERRESWRRYDGWRREQPVPQVSLGDGLRWLASALAVARLGPSLPDQTDQRVARVQERHRQLSRHR